MQKNVTNIAVYSGTFDPITNGHFDIAKRANKIFPNLVIAVAKDVGNNKKTLFSLAERVEMVKKVFHDFVAENTENSEDVNIKILPFEGLLVDFMMSINSNIIVRGIRGFNDMNSEVWMSHLNQKNWSTKKLFYRYNFFAIFRIDTVNIIKCGKRNLSTKRKH